MANRRYQHYLKDNKTSEYPYHYIFFDTETIQTMLNDRDIEHTLRLGVAIYWRRKDANTLEQVYHHFFDTPDGFWDVVTKYCASKRKLMIISHNLPFDMAIVKGWSYLDKLGFKPVKIILDFRCNIWKFRRDTTTLVFLDNMNYFQTSLETIGDSIGMTKLTMPSQDAPIQEWQAYCKRDADILLQVWCKWLSFLLDNELGSFGMTIASQALNAFRHRFMTCKIGIHDSAKAIAIERNAYRGGRNECFRLGDYHGDDFYLVDVNSMYPHVMAQYEYPCNLISTGSTLAIHDAVKLIYDYALIAECSISTQQPIYGIKANNKLIFPIGDFDATLTTQELMQALFSKHITAIGNYALYNRAKLFTDYVSFFYNNRLNFEQHRQYSFAYMCKLMLNSLYGKFGQRIEDWQFVCEDSSRDYDWWQEYDIKQKKIHTYRCINHRVEVSTGYHEGFNSLVAIAAEVTANARLYLWYLISEAGLSNVYYCDTDSIIVNANGMANLTKHLHISQLGQLKIVANTNRLSIRNLKDYSFGDMVRIKGIKRDAQMIAYNEYIQMQSLGIKTGLHLHDINRVIWREVTKTLSRDYTKGMVQNDGRVLPIRLTKSTLI